MFIGALTHTRPRLVPAVFYGVERIGTYRKTDSVTHAIVFSGTERIGTYRKIGSVTQNLVFSDMERIRTYRKMKARLLSHAFNERNVSERIGKSNLDVGTHRNV